MQTCSICQTQSPDSATICSNCHASLAEFSNSAVALKNMLENNRITYIRISVADDCCPACRKAEGTYKKNEVPRLPIEGCSHNLGCRCFYLPVLDVLYP